jgi:AcrR family transcriptional regulator
MSLSTLGPAEFKGLRKVPQQARSRARVQAVYAAAERTIGAEGVEALTMIRLASEAGVPVGTLYQFFEDKAAVLDAIAHRATDSFDSVVTQALETAADGDWRGLASILFDAFIQHARANPAYVAIRAGHYLSAELQRADDASVDAIAALVRAALVTGENIIDSPELATVCRVAVQVAGALLDLAFRLDPDGDADTLAQARRITLLYLEDIAAQHMRQASGTGPA